MKASCSNNANNSDVEVVGLISAISNVLLGRQGGVIPVDVAVVIGCHLFEKGEEVVPSRLKPRLQACVCALIARGSVVTVMSDLVCPRPLFVEVPSLPIQVPE